MSDQSYGGDNDPYWLSSRGVKAVNFVNQTSPPLGYMGKSILYTMDDFNLYFNGQRINGGLPGGTVSGPDTSTDKSIPRWNGTEGDKLLDGPVLLEDNGVFSEVGGVTFKESDVNPGTVDTLWMNTGGQLFIGDEKIGGVVGPVSSSPGTIPQWVNSDGTELGGSSCSVVDSVIGCNGVNLNPVSQLFNINGGNWEFRWNDGVDDYMIEVPVGQYNGGGLATKIEELVNLAGSLVTVTGAYSGLFTFTFSAPVSLKFLNSVGSIASTIGFPNSDSAVNAVHSGSATQSNGLVWVDLDNGHLMHGDVDLESSVVGGNFVDSSTFIVDAVDSTKRLGFDCVGSTGSTTTLATSQTSNRTLTLPDATDTLVGKATVDTLSNKSMVDSSTAVISAATPNRQLLFNILGAANTTTTLATSQTSHRVIVLPNASDTLVGKTTTDIFTNKTITDNTNNVAANSIKNSTGVVTVSAAAAPSAGQVLTATGATTAIWQNPSVTVFPFASLYWAGGTTPTTISCPTANLWNTIVSVTGTLYSNIGGTFTQPVDNRLQYAGTPYGGAIVSFNANVSGSSTGAWYVRLNGTNAGIAAASQQRVQGSTYTTISGTYVASSVNPGDNFQIEFMSASNTQTMTLLAYTITVHVVSP